MINPVERVVDHEPEPIEVHVPHKVKFKRMAQYVTFSSDSTKVIIAMQPVHQDKTMNPRKIVLVAVIEESDSLAKFILEQGAK